MTAQPEAVQHEAWTAAIPVRLTLSASEVTTVEGPPAPLHVLLPRCSYLPSVLNRALNHFRHVLPPEVKDAVNTPWFEDDGLPIRWQQPAGVLFDLLHRGKPGVVWNVTIHFRDFPSDTLLAWEGSHSTLQTYLNSLKEAAVICSGNAAAILQMSQQSQQNLWTSVEAADLSAYQRVASSLQLSPKAKGSRPAMIPVRLHIQRSSGDYMSSYESVEYTSRPVSAASNGQETSLLQTLQQILPQCFQPNSQQEVQSSKQATIETQEDQESSVQAGTSSSPDTALMHSSQQRSSDQYSVLVAGIKPPLQTPLVWLHAALHAPDLFLYITVIALQ